MYKPSEIADAHVVARGLHSVVESANKISARLSQTKYFPIDLSDADAMAAELRQAFNAYGHPGLDAPLTTLQISEDTAREMTACGLNWENWSELAGALEAPHEVWYLPLDGDSDSPKVSIIEWMAKRVSEKFALFASCMLNIFEDCKFGRSREQRFARQFAFGLPHARPSHHRLVRHLADGLIEAQRLGAISGVATYVAYLVTRAKRDLMPAHFGRSDWDCFAEGEECALVICFPEAFPTPEALESSLRKSGVLDDQMDWAARGEDEVAIMRHLSDCLRRNVRPASIPQVRTLKMWLLANEDDCVGANLWRDSGRAWTRRRLFYGYDAASEEAMRKNFVSCLFGPQSVEAAARGPDGEFNGWETGLPVDGTRWLSIERLQAQALAKEITASLLGQFSQSPSIETEAGR
jgi:hypothetical protein